MDTNDLKCPTARRRKKKNKRGKPKKKEGMIFTGIHVLV